MVHRLKRIKKSTWIKLGIGLILLVVASIALRFTVLRQLLSIEYVVQWVDQVRLNPWRLPIFLVVFIIGVCGLPITIFPIVGGVLFTFGTALAVNLAGATGGACLAFLIARFFGREAVEVILKGRLKALDQIAAERGFRTVLIFRLLGIPPYIITNYGLGLSAVKFWPYFTATVLGMFPWMVLVTYAADSLWKAVLVGGQEGLTKSMFKALAPLFGLSLAIMVGLVVGFFVKRKKAAALLTKPVHPHSHPHPHAHPHHPPESH